MRGGLTYQGNDHREAIEQLFKINDILPHTCEGGSKFDPEDFHRNIIATTLHEKARDEYIKRGRCNLRDEDVVDRRAIERALFWHYGPPLEVTLTP